MSSIIIKKKQNMLYLTFLFNSTRFGKITLACLYTRQTHIYIARFNFLVISG